MVTEFLLFVLVFFFLHLAFKKPSRLPPGIWGLPILGKLPDSSTCLAEQVKKLRPIYGDIITWRMGSRVNVFLCNFEVIKRAMAKLELSDRPDFHTYGVFGSGSMLGITFSNGALWQKNRRFALHQLRDLGMGKTCFEEVIQREAGYLVQDYMKHTGKEQPLPLSLGVAILNVVWKMVADMHYEMDDPRGQEAVELVCSTDESLVGAVYLFNLFPWLHKVAPPFFKKKLGYDKLQQCVGRCLDIVSEVLKDHKDTLDPSHPRDLIDQYLIQMDHNKGEATDAPYTEQDLRTMIIDLLFAGTDTILSTVRWAILYLAKHPEVQARVQRQIDQEVPRDSLLFYYERNKLPYLEAVIHEVHRIISLAPFAVPHTASADTMLDGYLIPKGTVVLPHLEFCHKDSQFWDQPNEFNPDHFLSPDGSFNNRKEGFLPFGIGRRVCVGVGLAKVEIFVFLTALLQNFTFSPPQGETLKTERDPDVIIINAPKPYRVVIEERQSVKRNE